MPSNRIITGRSGSGKIVNVKGQFLSGPSMKFAVERYVRQAMKWIWLTERGNSFGYTDLVVDTETSPGWKPMRCPWSWIARTPATTQSNQRRYGGNPELIETIAKAAIATGADGLFIETHPNPSVAKSDGANMLKRFYWRIAGSWLGYGKQYCDVWFMKCVVSVYMMCEDKAVVWSLTNDENETKVGCCCFVICFCMMCFVMCFVWCGKKTHKT